MKKVLIALAAFAMGTAVAHADSAFDGIYAGAEGGYGSVKVDGAGHDSAFSGSAFAGYGTTFGKIYLGGEGEVGINGAENSVGGVTVKQKVNYGAKAKLGYLATPKALVYGLAGWEHAEFDVSGSGSEGTDGVKFGFGAETFVQKNLSVRSEVTYTDWKDKGSLPGGNEVRTTLGLAVHF